MFRSLLLRLALAAACIAAADGAAAVGGMTLGVVVDGGAAPAMAERIPLDQLAALPQVELKAVTPWTDGVTTFGGVPFESLAHSLGIGSGEVTMRALNAYQITLNIAEVIANGGVLALRMNGRPIPIRDKGPIWLVFPSVDHPRLASADNAHMWIWQIDEIHFLAE